VDPTSKIPYFFFNQTLSSVAAGEPHPQPHYQTATKTAVSCKHFFPGNANVDVRVNKY